MVGNRDKEVSTYHYNRCDLADSFREVGLSKGDIVFSHSNIGFFGIPAGERTPGNTFWTILNAFFDVIGEEGTLAVPTFTYSFPQGKVFDPDNTPSDCGIFTEMLRKHPEAYRSNDPCISVAAIGKKAEELTQNIPENSYGPDSFFDRFYEADGVICNLNFDAGSTFVHYVERSLNVPYRFDKTFNGTFRKGDREEDKKCTIWVRYVSSDETIAVFEPFDRLAREEGLYKTAKVGRGFVGIITVKDTFSLIERTLPERPWLLTRAGKTGVIPELIPEE